MPEQRRRFSAQFKAEAVQMVIETGKPIASVARDLGIHDGTLGNWVNACVMPTPSRTSQRHRRSVPGCRSLRTRSAGYGWRTSS